MHIPIFRAVDWIAHNDEEGTNSDVEEVSQLMTVALVADLFGKSTRDIAERVIKVREQEERNWNS